MENNILHVDMDAFFASVEQLDNKEYRGNPVIVGGTTERGVVSTCSYEARKYGIRSAMPMFIAQKLCPNGIYVKPRFNRYKEISNKVFDILREVTNDVEPVSIDEAYLDISDSIFKSSIEAARFIKSKVRFELGLTMSVGISYNKFLAKLASDWNKPNGIKIISNNLIPSILLPLPISKIHGLGSKSVEKLNNMGIFNIDQLYKMEKDFYVEFLGKYGIEIYDRIRGIDNRKVEITRDRKSYGRERTLKFDTSDIDELHQYLISFSKDISSHLQKNNTRGKTIVLKFKTSDFNNYTRSRTLNHYTFSYEDIYSIAKELLDNENIDQGIRLIGLTITSFEEKIAEQLKLF